MVLNASCLLMNPKNVFFPGVYKVISANKNTRSLGSGPIKASKQQHFGKHFKLQRKQLKRKDVWLLCPESSKEAVSILTYVTKPCVRQMVSFPCEQTGQPFRH